MKIAIYARPQREYSADDIRNLLEAVDDAGIKYVVNTDFAPVIEDLLDIEITDEKRFDDLNDFTDIDMIVC